MSITSVSQKYLSLFILSLALALPLIAEAKNKDKINIESSKISLSSDAILHKPADELQMNIGVVNIGVDAETALTDNSTSMQAVIESLQTVGLTTDEFQSGRFSIQPTYTPYPTNPPSDWKPSINGYEVTNTISIHTSKMDLAGKLIDAASQAGANSVSNISFGLSDSRIYWKETLAAATTNAMEDAETIAKTAGVKLGRVLAISLNSTHVKPLYMDSNFACQAMKCGGAIPPIEPGDVTITANVSIIYELKSK